MKVILLCLVSSAVASRLTVGNEMRQVVKLLSEVADEREAEFKRMEKDKADFDCWATKAIKGLKGANQNSLDTVAGLPELPEQADTMEAETQAAQKMRDDTEKALARAHKDRTQQHGSIIEKGNTMGNLMSIVEGMKNKDTACETAFGEMAAAGKPTDVPDAEAKYNPNMPDIGDVDVKGNVKLIQQSGTASGMICNMMLKFFQALDGDWQSANKQYNSDVDADAEYKGNQEKSYKKLRTAVKANADNVAAFEAANQERKDFISAEEDAREKNDESMAQIQKRKADTDDDWSKYSNVATGEIKAIRDTCQHLIQNEQKEQNFSLIQKPKASLAQITTSLEALAMRSPMALAVISEIRELKNHKGSKAFLQSGGAIQDAISAIQGKIDAGIEGLKTEDKQDTDALDDCKTFFQSTSKDMVNAATSADKSDTERSKSLIERDENASSKNDAEQNKEELKSEHSDVTDKKQNENDETQSVINDIEGKQIAALNSGKSVLEAKMADANSSNDFIQMHAAPNVGFNADYQADSRGPVAIIDQLINKSEKQVKDLKNKQARTNDSYNKMLDNLQASVDAAAQSEENFSNAEAGASADQTAAVAAVKSATETLEVAHGSFDDNKASCLERGESYTRRMADRASERGDLKKVKAILTSVASAASASDSGF